ncbi:hypothetical protein [Gordonia otitidis]|nr:hypothetical protein [Gordonia otitidis]
MWTTKSLLNSLRIDWWAAVERGGTGDGAAALTMLSRLRERARIVDASDVVSLAWSTTASLYRQAGRHDVAIAFDAAALSALPGPVRCDDPWLRVAAHDALVGLAADNLGQLRFPVTARLLARAGELCPGYEPSFGGGTDARDAWTHFVTEVRPRVRERWVGTELAIYTGEGEQARRRIGEAQALLTGCVARTHERHRIKTDLIAAAASADDKQDAYTVAVSCLDRARAAGLEPLAWAALSLMRGLGDTSEVTIAGIARSHDMLVDRGMPFHGRS